MGLLSNLLLLPLAPVRVAGWTLDQVVDAAEQQYYDPAALRRELAELARDLDAGRIGAAEFDRREDELLDLLEASEARKRGAP
ncbi:Gas vesicle protein G [Actinomadura rubteroloni]|uniref:Gas vesicle protein G n=1 Tax=Actinomadura rubteroloni TaxID=1926885 RepID=A0A2P4UKW0_9ACTN|nr:gas vesicle protein GvpG [Actinomadura rubteroloni]POM25685.1 Gas vesicle protein G [Actinomadura rubteroloni]